MPWAPGYCSLAGMRRSEVSALRWAVRRTKTNQEGEVNDVRFREDRRCARPPHAARRHESGTGRPRGAVVGADDRAAIHGRGACRWYREPGDRALGAGRAGVGADEPGRVDHRLSCSLGNWKTSRMVAHYSAGATAEHGAVARYL